MSDSSPSPRSGVGHAAVHVAPPRVRSCAVLFASGFVWSLAVLLAHGPEALAHGRWLWLLGGVALVHALAFLLFLKEVEHQTAALLRHLLDPAPCMPGEGGASPDMRGAASLAEVRRTLHADPLPPPSPDAIYPYGHPEVCFSPPGRDGDAMAGKWRTGVGVALSLLSLAITLAVSLLVFPAARDLALDGLTLPALLSLASLLGAGLLAARRLEAGAALSRQWRDQTREALADFLGSMPWEDAPTERYIAGLTVEHRKESHAGDPARRATVVTRAQTVGHRHAHLARVDLLLDQDNLLHRVLMALLRQAAGQRALRQDRAVLEPLEFAVVETGDLYYQHRRLEQAELLAMAMRLARVVLRQGG